MIFRKIICKIIGHEIKVEKIYIKIEGPGRPYYEGLATPYVEYSVRPYLEYKKCSRCEVDNSDEVNFALNAIDSIHNPSQG